ncbi:hypothetical protein ACFL59_01205 [Planctomycetota bacterium]
MRPKLSSWPPVLLRRLRLKQRPRKRNPRPKRNPQPRRTRSLCLGLGPCSAPETAEKKDEPTAEKVKGDEPEKKLSAKERLAARRAARAKSKTEDGAEAGEKKLSVKERIALRKKKAAEAAAEAAKKQITALTGEGAAAELQSQIEALQKESAEKDDQIHNLELSVQEAQAGIGAAAEDPDERLTKARERQEAAEAEAAKVRAQAQKFQKALKRRVDEVARLKGQISGDAPDAYGDSEDLVAAIEEKNGEVDQLQAELLEAKGHSERLQRRINEHNEEMTSRSSGAERQLASMEEKVGEYLEEKHAAEKELQRFKKEYEEFEETVVTLSARVDDLTERNDILQYRLEQSEQKVGEIVRGKLVEMQMQVEEMEQANQQLQSLVEAYEEKIDEMDTRIEEMEAENEELEKLLEEEREAHEKSKQDADKNERALRKRLQMAVGEKGGSGGALSLEEATAEAQ